MDNVDPCLFIYDKVICPVYVDETLFFSQEVKYISKANKKLSNAEWELKVEDSVSIFIGVNINQNHHNGSIKLTNTGLAKQIIGALYICHLTIKSTPSTVKPLVKYKEGYPPDGTYNYSSFIRLLQYPQRLSHPDVTYAASACAHFVISQKCSHEILFECTVHYLKGTLEEGIILIPSG